MDLNLLHLPPHLPPFVFDKYLVYDYPGRMTWNEVYGVYRDNEVNLEHWKKYYESQNYKSWEEWREKFIRRFGMRHLAWDMKTARSPLVIENFRGAGFRGWHKLTGHRYLTFGEMSTIKAVQDHPYLQGLIDNFPARTTIIAIRYNHSIFVIEGMHRCAAYALARVRGIEINTKFNVIIGHKSGIIRPVGLGMRI